MNSIQNHRRQTAAPTRTTRHAWWRGSLLILVFIATGIVGPSPGHCENLAGDLFWKCGDQATGSIVSVDRDNLVWRLNQSPEVPLELDLKYLREIKFTADDSPNQTTEPHFVQTIDGGRFYGQITKLDNRTLSVSSRRLGDVQIDRTQIMALGNVDGVVGSFFKKFDLNNWQSEPAGSKVWEVNDDGFLKSKRKNIGLLKKTDFPERALIEVKVSAARRLDFRLAFGVPTVKRDIESLPCLASWEDRLVLTYKETSYAIIKKLDTNELSLLIDWDRITHQMIVMNPAGDTLVDVNVGELPKGVVPGIYIQNRTGDLTVERLTIDGALATFEGNEPAIKSLDQGVFNGRLVAFDGKTWTFTQNEKVGKASESTIPASKFLRALAMNPLPEEDAKGKQRPGNSANRIQLFYGDGAVVRGEVISLADQTAQLETEFATEPVTLQLAGLEQIAFDTADPEAEVAELPHRQFDSTSQMSGRLEPGSGDDIYRWRSVGARAAIPVSPQNSRFVLRTDDPVARANTQWTDTLYLTNQETVPCRIIGIDGNSIKIDSFARDNLIDPNMVKAIDFGCNATTPKVTVKDDAWTVPAEKNRKVKIKTKSIEIFSEGEISHPWLLCTNRFDFDLTWAGTDGVVALDCDLFVNDFAADDQGNRFRFEIQNDKLVVIDPITNQTLGTPITTEGDRARVSFALKREMINVSIDGQPVHSEQAPTDTTLGMGVTFKLDRTGKGVSRSCSISDFKLVSSSSGGNDTVDLLRKNSLLTIPRLQQANPPSQILCAVNGDMLRGTLVSLDAESIVFRCNNTDRRFPRDVVTSLVWLNLKPKQSQASTDSSAKKTVQVLLQDGLRMSAFNVDAWRDGKLTGTSSLLGVCEIPIGNICELRFGSSALESAKAPYMDWVAMFTPQPRIEEGSADDSAGGSSPLIGITPKSFTVSKLDGSEFSLDQQIGKVVVLDFWATWCGPCVRALPEVTEAISTYSAEDVSFLALNQQEAKKTIERFLKTRKLDFPIGLDTGDIAEQFDITGLPTTVIIDRQGKIAVVKVGSSRNLGQKLKSAIDQLLADTNSE